MSAAPTQAWTPPDPNASGEGQNIQRGASEVAIDHVNQWMRTTPWYREQVASWGQNPDRPTGLNGAQKTAIMRAAQAHGVVIDEGNIEVDQGGNFNPKGHKLRNTMIVVGIAAATIATMGAAGAFAGAAGVGSSAATTGGTLAATTLPTATGTIAGGVGLGAGGSAGILSGAAGVAGATGAGVAGAATGATAAGGTAAAAGGIEAAGMGAGGALGEAATAIPAAVGGTSAAAGTLTSIPDFVGPTQQAATGTNSILSNADRFQNVGRVLNGVNTGQQQGREAEANATTAWDRNANQRYANSIDAAALNLKAPQQRGAASVQGDILANAKPFEWTGQTKMVGNTPVPQYSGGLSPALFSDNTKALGSLMSQQALQQQQQNGGQAVGPQDPLTPLPKVGPGGKIISTAGTIASLYGAYMGGR